VGLAGPDGDVLEVTEHGEVGRTFEWIGHGVVVCSWTGRTRGEARRDSRWLPPSMRHPLGKPPRCGIRPDSPLDGGPPIAGAPRTAGRTQLIQPSKRDSLVHVAPFEPRARRRRATRPS